MHHPNQLDVGIVLILGAVSLVATAGSMAFRMLEPVPVMDRGAIERVLQSKRLRLVRVKKLLTGGPWSGTPHGRYSSQVGRPYRITAVGDDGVERVLVLAADGTDLRGDPVIKECVGPDEWKVVSAVRSPQNLSAI